MTMDQNIIDDFISNAYEHLENAQHDLLLLEKQSDKPNPQLIDQIFRGIHSIKGSAGLIKKMNISILSHDLEALLQIMRDGEILPESIYIQAMLDACDQLENLIENLDDSDQIDIKPMSRKLIDLKNNGPRPENLALNSPIRSIQQLHKVGFDIQPSTFIDGSGGCFYILHYNFTSLYQDNQITPLTLFLELISMGKIVDIQAKTQADLTDDLFQKPLSASIVYHTIVDMDMLATILNIDISQIQEIKIEIDMSEINSQTPNQTDNNKSSQSQPESQKDIQQNIPSQSQPKEKIQTKQSPIPQFEPKPQIESQSKPQTQMQNHTQIQTTTQMYISSQNHTQESSFSNVSQMMQNASNPLDQNQLPIKQIDIQPTHVSPKTIIQVEDTYDTPMNDKVKKSKETAETIRIKVDLLNNLMTLAGELVLARNQQLQIIEEFTPSARTIAQRINLVTTQMQEAIMRTRMQPVGHIFAKLPRLVRDISKKIDKPIQIITSGDDVELDKSILESLSDPLTHIIRNACDHGIEFPKDRLIAGKSESGLIQVRAYHEAGHIHIEVQDDGRGMDIDIIRKKILQKQLKTQSELERMSEKEIMSLIMIPGFSTTDQPTEISGRGVGMDVVKSGIEKQGGTVELISEKGEGTLIHLQLPLTLAIIPCLIVSVDNDLFAIPKVNVLELVCLYDKDVYTKIEFGGNQEVYRLREQLLPMVRMRELLKRPEKLTEFTRADIAKKCCQHAKDALAHDKTKSIRLIFAVVKYGTQRFGLIVDKVIGSEEIVVNPMHPSLKFLNIYSGTTIMGDGQVALILDINGIANHTGVSQISDSEKDIKKNPFTDPSNTQRVLVFKSGPKEQFAIPLPLIRRVEEISKHQFDSIGDYEFITLDGISTRIIRLDKVFHVSECIEKQYQFLLLPRNSARPFGILCSQLIDVVNVPLSLNEETYTSDGILGTAHVLNHMTIFPDIYRLIEIVDPSINKSLTCQLPETTPCHSYKILLVEDTPFFRRLVKSFLESNQYLVNTAENGVKAIELLEKEQYDLLVSDIEMPEMDGWALLKYIRNDERFRALPAIALTSLDSPEDRAMGKRVGFDRYEIKLDRQKLLISVNELLDNTQ